MIKVYKMNDYDWVASHMDAKATNNWYNKEFDCENKLEDVHELKLDENTIFYEVAMKEALNKVTIPINEAVTGNYVIPPNGEMCKKITLREAISREGEYKEPYVIASTEF